MTGIGDTVVLGHLGEQLIRQTRTSDSTTNLDADARLRLGARRWLATCGAGDTLEVNTPLFRRSRVFSGRGSRGTSQLASAKGGARLPARPPDARRTGGWPPRTVAAGVADHAHSRRPAREPLALQPYPGGRASGETGEVSSLGTKTSPPVYFFPDLPKRRTAPTTTATTPPIRYHNVALSGLPRKKLLKWFPRESDAVSPRTMRMMPPAKSRTPKNFLNVHR